MNVGPCRESALIRAVLLGLLVATVNVPGGSAHATPAARPASGAASADYFVSPDGNDKWTGRLADPGTNDGPFATITRALDAVRALLQTGKHTQSIRVLLRGGVHYLDQTVEFGPEDSGTAQSPVVYAGRPGENVIVSGGRRLVDGRWGEVIGHKAWVIDIPEVRDNRWRFRQLFVNGERRPRTRLPKQGENRIESLPSYTGDFLRSPTKRFVYAPGHIVPTWRNLRDVEVVGITRWLDRRHTSARPWTRSTSWTTCFTKSSTKAASRIGTRG